MKLSQQQQNYITAQAICEAALQDEAISLEEFEQALDLLEIRERELLVGARNMVVKLSQMFKHEGELSTVLTMFDKVIAGEFIHPEKKEKLIALCLKVSYH